jgi:hypothetical protein
VDRPRVGQVYDWVSHADGSQLEVTVVAYDSIRGLFTARVRDFDPILKQYAEEYEWAVFRQNGEDDYTILCPCPDTEASQG